jgi:pimeloyl-ACP methyl ester carboxylesterase
MFDFFNLWKGFMHHKASTRGMSMAEKEPGQKISYGYPLKKIKISDDDIEIAYIDEGKKDGDTIILIHGMGGGVPTWIRNIATLKAHTRCIALDLPGHGYSSRGNFPYTINFYADCVLEFIGKLGIESATLIGHSMGGQISIVAAIKSSNIVEKLILVSPAGIEPYTGAEKQLLINMTAGLVATGNAFTQQQLNMLIGFSNDQKQADELASRLAFFKGDGAEFGRLMLRSVEGMLLESVNDILHTIQQPCLMVVGKQDKISPYQFLRREDYVDSVRKAASKIPNARLMVLSPCGHFVQFQRPKSFNRLVEAFLKEKEVVS